MTEHFGGDDNKEVHLATIFISPSHLPASCWSYRRIAGQHRSALAAAAQSSRWWGRASKRRRMECSDQTDGPR